MLAPENPRTLDAIVARFDDLAADRDPSHLPLLLRIEGPWDADEVALGTRPLHGEHPGGILLGWQVPEEWSALGVASVGWALPTDRFEEADVDRNAFRAERPSAAADRVRVRMTVLVSRDGTIAGSRALGDGERVLEPPTQGAMVDALLRCMGAPTAAAAFGTIELFTLWWLAEVVGAAEAGGRPLQWPAAAALHPAMRMLDRAVDVEPRHLEAAGRALANVCGWTELRRQARRGGTAWLREPADADWFDDGSFARWTVGSYPPLDRLLADAADAMTPSAARRARAVVRRWGLVTT